MRRRREVPGHQRGRIRTHRRMLLGACLVAALVAGSCSSDKGSNAASPSTTSTAPGGTTQPTAPESQRVDLAEPTFSNPTEVHNPWFPISDLHSAVILGNEEGDPLKIETTLLPDHETVRLKNGERVELLISQFVAYLDGRIHEVAIDRYAQDDAGNVWYFGEDVYNYEDGVVADTEGTWIAGKDGPPGMIMPADPHVGDAHRPENIPGFVFEEVVIKSVDQTVEGPRGPVGGVIVGTENHLMEGHYEDKTFGPGYGEFRSGVGGNLEAMALAVPTDAVQGGVPANLAAVSKGAGDIFRAAGSGDWKAAAGSFAAMQAAWSAHQASTHVPPLLRIQLDRALDALAGDETVPALAARNAAGTRRTVLDVAQAALDLELQYRPPPEVDLARFKIWAESTVVDGSSDEADPGQVASDIAALEWTWDRIANTVDEADASDIEAQLKALRAAADDEDTEAAATGATQLLETLAGGPPGGA
jgi:hypothetical protein